eukprot:3168606-Pyramimonas_sp.AAC.1
MGETLPVNIAAFSICELAAALRALSTGKAAGVDEVPPEFYRSLLCDSEAMQSLLSLFRRCWDEKAIPDEWQIAVVALLHRKGDTSLPENYRPISLLPVAYKLLAWMMHKRLQKGGAESRIRNSQFGFRPNRSASQAIAI